MQSVLLRTPAVGGCLAALARPTRPRRGHATPPIERARHPHRRASPIAAAAARPSHGSIAQRAGVRSRISPARVVILHRPAAPLRAAAGDAPPSPSPPPAAVAPDTAVAAERRRGVRTVLAELKGLDMPPSEVLRYARGAVRLPKRAPLAADGVPIERAAEALAQLMMQQQQQQQQEQAAGGGGGGGIAAQRAASSLEQLRQQQQQQQRQQQQEEGGGGESSSAACDDPRALAALNHLLTDLWRWKRRGGGSRWDEDDAATSPSAVALLELQGVDLGGGGRNSAVGAAAGAGAAGGGGEQDGDGGIFGNLDAREKQEVAVMMRGVAMAGLQNAFWGAGLMSAIVLLLLNFARGGG